MVEKTFHIWVGYDERAPQAFQVCKHTLEKHSSGNIKVHKLCHRTLRKEGLFKREWKIDAEGQYLDLTDGRTFSTQFSHSRFLVPELWRNLKDPNKSSLAMFVDCDFIFMKDLQEVFSLIEFNAIDTPLWTIPHNYKPSEVLKMDGMEQSSYNMKLWSSLMVFEMNHKDNEKVTVEYVNTEDGRNLHQFKWVENRLSIGCLPEDWNFIPNHSEKNTKVMSALHLTEGGPWVPEYKNCRYSGLWLEAYEDFLQEAVLKVNLKVEALL